MAAPRCLKPSWLPPKRIRQLQSLLITTQTSPASTFFSTTSYTSQASTNDSPSSSSPSATPSNSTTSDPSSSSSSPSKLSRPGALPGPNRTPDGRISLVGVALRPQDEIKHELVRIAQERNVPIPRELDPQSPDIRLPRAVQALYLTPLRRTPTHGNPVANLQLRSYSVRNLELMADFAMRAAYFLNLPARGPVPLPRITERWTVPKSHFIYKKSQENFERVTLRRLVQIQDGDPEVVRRWLGFLRKWCWYGVGMKCDVFEWEDVNVVKKMDQVAADVGSQIENIKWENFGRRKDLYRREDYEKILDKKGFGAASPSSAVAPSAPTASASVAAGAGSSRKTSRRTEARTN